MEVFRAGEQTDSSGHTKEWTEDDLDKIIASTNKIGEDIPATVGHPKDNSPSFAWFKSAELFRKGKVLFAKMSDITKEFKKALKEKKFKNRSIALRPDFSLRHIAFLGGVMPAVKGLAELKFNEKEEFSSFDFSIHEDEFSDHKVVFGLNLVGRIFQKIKDRKIEKDGVEKAEDMISQFDIDTLKEITPEQERLSPAFSEENPGDDPDNGDKNMDFKEELEKEKELTTKLNSDLATKTTESKDFSEKLVASEKKVTELENEKLAFAEKVRDEDFNTYAEKLVAEGNILPAEKASTLITLKALYGQEALDFKDADGKDIKKTPIDNYKETLEAKKGGISIGGAFKEAGTAANSVDQEIDTKIEAIMEKDKVNFVEASARLRKKEPGLFKEATISQEIEDK